MARVALLVALALVACGATMPAEPEAPAAVLAGVLCAECKHCSPEERAAIGHVAIGRATWAASWWGDGLVEVLRKRRQFARPSSACRWKLRPRADGQPWSRWFVEWHRERLALIHYEAEALLAAEVDNPTPLATHFHAVELGEVWPWLVAVDAPQAWRHRFYCDAALVRRTVRHAEP